MQRVKEALTPGKHHHNEYHAGGVGLERPSVASSDSSGSSGMMGQQVVGTGVVEVPVVYTANASNTVGTGHGLDSMSEEVCGQKTFTEVEDRPVVKERVEKIVEHHAVEKQYVVETRFVGERPIPSATGTTHIHTKERVIEAAQPGPRCPPSTGAVMDTVIEGFTGRNNRLDGDHI